MAAAVVPPGEGARVAALAASPFHILDASATLRLVLDLLPEDTGDVFCAALSCSQFRDAVAARFPRGTVTSGAACIACSQSRERWVRELGAASPQWVENYCALPAALPPLQSVAEEVMKRQGTGQWCYTLAAKQPGLEPEQLVGLTHAKASTDLLGSGSHAPCRLYQLHGLNWLLELRRRGLSGILMDEMGLGKTIQSVALLRHLLSTDPQCGPFLIVAPRATHSQWEWELQRFAPQLNVATYSDRSAERHVRFSALSCSLDRSVLRNQLTPSDHSATTLVHAVLTTPQIMTKDHLQLGSVEWEYLVYDEAHRLSSHSNSSWMQNQIGSSLLRSHNFSFKHRLFLSCQILHRDLYSLAPTRQGLPEELLGDDGNPPWLDLLLPHVFQRWSYEQLFGHVCDEAAVRALIQPLVLRRRLGDIESVETYQAYLDGIAPGAIERADAMSRLVEAHELAAVRNAVNAGLCM